MGNGLCVETSSAWTVFDWLDKVLGSVGGFVGVKLKNDDEIQDRLSHHYTTMILLVFCIVVSTKQYVGDSIQCWCPAQFTDAHVAYTNQVCWVSNTYYIPMSEVIPTNDEPKKMSELTYYQWIPMILLFMALLFKLPRIMWKALTSTTAVNLDRMVTLIFEASLAPREKRDEVINDIVLYLDDWFETAKQYRTDCCVGFRDKVARYSCFICGRRYGNYFMTASLFIKTLYALNAILQFFVLNSFLGTDFSMYGFEVMNGLALDEPQFLKESPRFPRVTLCDFQIRQMQNIQRWTVQCVLPINLFNEKIFLFIWFWLVLLSIASVTTLITNFYAIMFPMKRLEYIKKYLKIRKAYSPQTENDRRQMRKFVFDYLKFDGVFVLRVAGHNATDVLVAQLIEKLWIKYKDRYGNRRNKHENGVDF